MLLQSTLLSLSLEYRVQIDSRSSNIPKIKLSSDCLWDSELECYSNRIIFYWWLMSSVDTDSYQTHPFTDFINNPIIDIRQTSQRAEPSNGCSKSYWMIPRYFVNRAEIVDEWNIAKFSATNLLSGPFCHVKFRTHSGLLLLDWLHQHFIRCNGRDEYIEGGDSSILLNIAFIVGLFAQHASLQCHETWKYCTHTTDGSELHIQSVAKWKWFWMSFSQARLLREIRAVTFVVICRTVEPMIAIDAFQEGQRCGTWVMHSNFVAIVSNSFSRNRF